MFKSLLKVLYLLYHENGVITISFEGILTDFLKTFLSSLIHMFEFFFHHYLAIFLLLLKIISSIKKENRIPVGSVIFNSSL